VTAPLRRGTPVRTLPNVLRQALATPADAARVLVGTVTAVPDPAHVTVDFGAAQATVARLAGYTPTVGEPCYVLTSGVVTLALGTVTA
jgi:hypothetical protein